MKSLKILLLLVSILIGLSCCDDNSTNPGNNTEHYYPLKVGNSWTYTRDVDGTPQSQTIIIDSSLTLNNEKTAYRLSNYYFEYSFHSKYVYYEGSKLFVPYRKVYIEIFDESKFNSNTETIVVPAGKFEATKFEWHVFYRYTSVETFWLVRGVGIVKIDNNGEIIELESYSVNQ